MKSFLSFTCLDSTVASGDAKTKRALVGEHKNPGVAAGCADRPVWAGMPLPRGAARAAAGQRTPCPRVARCLSELIESRVAHPRSRSEAAGCKRSGPRPKAAVRELPLVPSPSIFGRGMENIAVVQQIKMVTM